MAEKKKPREDKAAQSKEGPARLALPIEWFFPEGQIGRYANQVLVQNAQHECHVSFFEVRPPVLLGEPDEVREQTKNLKSVRAECVARIIVAKDFIPEIIKALQDFQDQQKPAAADSNG
jgi:hypothetical protein